MRRIGTLFLALLIFVSSVQAKYVCTTDEPFIQWLNQEPVDINDDTVLIKYSDNTSCQTQCRKTNSCLSSNTSVAKNLSNLSTALDESEKDSFENTANGKNITALKITSMTGSVAVLLNNFDGSNFTFPATNGTRTVYNQDGTVIKTQRLNPYKFQMDSSVSASTLSTSDRDSIKDKVNSHINSSSDVVGFEINSDRIIINSGITNNSFTWNSANSEKTIIDNDGYEIKLVTDSTATNKYYIKYKYAGVTRYAFNGENSDIKVIYRTVESTPEYRISVSLDGFVHEQSDNWTSDPSGSVYQNEQLGFDIVVSQNGYTCPLFDANADIGGDVDTNLFSSTSSCDSQCFIQHPCTQWTDNPKCTPTAFDKSHPVSDYTGKTVFTKQNITWDCDTSETIAGECIAYEKQTIQGDLKFDTSKIGWKSKEFAGADEAMAAIAGLDQLGHIWSGWEGECEDGMLFDNSWMSDPMTLLSLAMMAYTGALQQTGTATTSTTTTYSGGQAVSSSSSTVASGTTVGTTATSTAATTTSAASTTVTVVQNVPTYAYGSLAHSAASSVSNTFNSIGTATTNFFSGTGSSAVGGLNTIGGQSIAQLSSNGLGFDWSTVQNFYDTELIGATSYTQAVTYGKVAMGAASIIAAGMSDPVEDDFELADDFMKTQLGGNAKSIAAVNYSQCMASIGLSFPNMVGYSVDQNDSMSSQLREPWKNVISLSDNQLAHLMHATSESYVRASYIMLSYDEAIGVGRYIALTSPAYTQSGQVICGNGNVALAMNALNDNASDENSGANSGAMAMAAIGVALAFLPPPLNLIATIIFKIITSMSSGDACTDEDIAMKWGIQQFKTNKALQGEQCHEWWWGACMRSVTYYCCYDQQMSRIFVEGVKEQLGKPWEEGECDDISLSDLKDISFRKCLVGESPIEDKCFPIASWMN